MDSEFTRFVQSVEAMLGGLLAEHANPRVSGLRIEKSRLESRWSEFLRVYLVERSPDFEWVDLKAELNEIERRLNTQFRTEIPVSVVWPARMLGPAGAERTLLDADDANDSENFRSVKLEGDQDD